MSPSPPPSAVQNIYTIYSSIHSNPSPHMSRHADPVRLHLARGPIGARQLVEALGISQPTLSRAMLELGNEVVRIGAARSIQYALRDEVRGLSDVEIYRVDLEARVHHLGTLTPVRPDGFVMREADGATLYCPGLPWWLLDMRPQGYLGRAYAARHGRDLGLPERLIEWSDTHALKALLAQGHDVVGNLLLGDRARARFLHLEAARVPIGIEQKTGVYARMAQDAANGEAPGSSTGGEQPKFAAWAMTASGPRHVLVKFSEPVEGPVSERWRDLLLAEHLALETLAQDCLKPAREIVGVPERVVRVNQCGNHVFACHCFFPFSIVPQQNFYISFGHA